MMNGYGAVLEGFGQIVSREEIEREEYNGAWMVEGRVIFVNGWKLDFMEFRSEDKHKYRFHLMDEDDELVTRWDTAPHFPSLDNFPFHRHTGDGVEPTPEMKGEKILEEACERVVEAI